MILACVLVALEWSAVWAQTPLPPQSVRPPEATELPETFNAFVVSVTDGNWFESEADGRHVSVRLYGLLCPNRKTVVGEAAAQDLGRLLYGKTVRVKRVGYSVYGGVLGIVSVDNLVSGQTQTTQVNEVMISRGWAVARAFLNLPTVNDTYVRFEADAKAKGLGLWYRPGATVRAK